MNAYDWIFIGLFFDVSAAFVLASSFMMKLPVEAADEAATRFGQNIALFRSAMFQKNEAWCGAGLFSLGFALQFIGNYQSASGSAGLGRLDSWPAMAGAGMVVAFVAYLALLACRRDAQDRFFEHVFSPFKPEDFDSKPVPAESAFRTARLWGVKVGRGETNQELAVRLTVIGKDLVTRYSAAARIHGVRPPAEIRDRYK